MLTRKLWMQASLSRVGIDPTAALARARSQSRGRKRVRSEGPADVEMGEAEQPKRLHSSKSRYFLLVKAAVPDCRPDVVCRTDCARMSVHIFAACFAFHVTQGCHGSASYVGVPCRSMSRGRALSTQAGKGLKDASQQNKAIKIGDKATFKRGKLARKGEGDRHIPTLRPKHLLSGKRGNGKTDRR